MYKPLGEEGRDGGGREGALLYIYKILYGREKTLERVWALQ